MIKSAISYRSFILNILIIAPSLFLLVYLGSIIIAYLSIFWIVLLIGIFLVKHLAPGSIREYVYPVSVILFLLFLLGTFFKLYFNYTIPILSYVVLPLTFTTLTSLTFAIGVILLMEAVIQSRLSITVAEYTGSLLIFMEQLAVVTVMFSTSTILVSLRSEIASILLTTYHINNPSLYVVSYFTTISLEANALYNLVVLGYQFYLPLATFNVPESIEITLTFVISALGILLSMYTRSGKGYRGIESVVVPVMAGFAIGLPVFLLSEYLSSYNFQITFIFLAVAVLLFLVGYTSRHVSGSEKINTPIK